MFLLWCEIGPVFEGFALSELLKGIENYWTDRELRNRYFHDDWFVVIRDGTPAIRDLPRKKGSKSEFNDPTAEEIWELAERFREYEDLFSYAASVIGRRHQQPDPAPASAPRRSRRRRSGELPYG
jgi:hypothetical protein